MSSKREDRNSARAYAPNMAPPPRRKRRWRGPLGIVLTLILPPVGMAYLWRLGVFRTRGRVVLTVLGAAILTVNLLR